MSNIKISELTSIDAVASGDVLPIVDVSAGSTKKASAGQIIAAIPAATSSVVGTMSTSDKIKLDASTASATNGTLVARDGSGNTAVNVLTAAQVTITGTPTNATDATNKSYVDGLASGLTIKAAVVAATTTNLTLGGGTPNTLDGVSLSLNDRVLVKDQTDAKQNGIYIVATVGSGSNGTWTRATDADTGVELPTGSYVFVAGGATQGSSSYVMNTSGTITIGTSNIVWVLFSAISSVPASSIIGQIVASQIAAAAITTAKFAAGLTPVEIVNVVPTSGNFEGRLIYLTTTDGSFAADKLYRWTNPSITTGNTYWTASVPAVDITGNLTDAQIADLSAAKLTGQITNTQISDNAISTPKLQAGSITTAKIAALAVTAAEINSGAITTSKLAAGAVTANELAANSVIAGKVQAGAINTSELAAGAVNASKIAAGTITATQIASNTILAGNIATGTITADRMNVTNLSAITANLGTIMAGSITGTTITAGSGVGTVSISSSGLNIASSRITMAGDGVNPWIRVYGAGSYVSDYVELTSTTSGSVPPFIACGSAVVISKLALATNNVPVLINGSGQLLGTGSIVVNPGNANCLDLNFGEDPTGGSFQGYLTMKVNGRTVKVQFYT